MSNYHNMQIIFHFTDINECDPNSDSCDNNAVCDNTVGSFTCECNDGYAGDGTTCTGNFNKIITLFKMGLFLFACG